MTDYFALLEVPRRPWLEPELLKEKFLGLSPQAHPDRQLKETSEREAAQRNFADLNAAYQCLQQPRERLLHLLELELGSRPQQAGDIPGGLMDMFLGVADLCREADQVLEQKRSTVSPLLQVQTFELSQRWIDRLTAAQKELRTKLEAQLARLKQLDARWQVNQAAGSAQPQEIASELAGMCQVLGYLNRWSAQIQERITQLSF